MEKATHKAPCPICTKVMTCQVLACHTEKYEDQYIWIKKSYLILRCGCECIFFTETTLCSEDEEPLEEDPATGEVVWHCVPRHKTYPCLDKRPLPEWIKVIKDPTLESIIQECYSAFANELKSLAAAGIRTAFERAVDKLGADPASNFLEKLDWLEGDGRIGPSEREILETLTEGGHAAVHRAWNPSDEQLNLFFSILEAFLQRNLFLLDAARTLKEHIPPKPKRRPKTSS